MLRSFELVLKRSPLRTMLVVRAAPLPIALKNYGMSALPAELVPLGTFAVATLGVNAPFSVAWTLTGSSASSLHDAIRNGNGGGDWASSDMAPKAVLAVALFAVLGWALLARLS